MSIKNLKRLITTRLEHNKELGIKILVAELPKIRTEKAMPDTFSDEEVRFVHQDIAEDLLRGMHSTELELLRKLHPLLLELKYRGESMELVDKITRITDNVGRRLSGRYELDIEEDI